VGLADHEPALCDEAKYGIVEQAVKHFQKIAADGGKLAGQPIRELVTVNGIRIVLQDGTWGLVRASSNKPELVVVCESPTSEEMMKAMFKAIDMHLSDYPEVGEYNQKIA
jgi:phosphomannomutase/phosphoglucomutase